MSGNVVQVGTRNIAQVLDLVGQPSFMLDVDGPRKFRFAHINKQHVAETGIDTYGLIGCAPHDVFPERLADTIVENYERCRASACIETYDEQLELSGKTRWWKTTLTPVCCGFDGGKVLKIIGTAVDITDAKLQEMELTKTLSAQMAASESVRAFATNAMVDSQGPMRAVLAWLDILRDGFVDLGDGKLQEMDRVQQLAIDAVVGMDEVLLSGGFAVNGLRPDVVIDLAHVCRDIAALVDPDRRIAMRLPVEVIEGDWAVIQIVVRSLIEEAAKLALSELSLNVMQDDAGMLAFTILYDNTFDTGSIGPFIERGMAFTVIKERGGHVEMSSDRETGSEIRVTLPGRIHNADASDQETDQTALSVVRV